MSILQDLRYGFRLLRKNPGYAALSVVTLALGIGLTTMMFSIVYGAVLRGLPFEEAERLIHVQRHNPSEGIDQMAVTQHDFEDLREQQTVFTGMAGYYTGTVNVSGTERAERLDGGFVSPEFFEVLRVRPALGRSFRPEEGLPGAAPVVVLGHDVWTTRYGGDPGIVGRTVRANGEEMTVIGVMPEGFQFPTTQSIWLPLRSSAAQMVRGEGMQLNVVARLRPGVSMDEAQVQVASIAARLAGEYPETNRGVEASVSPLLESFIPEEPRRLLFTMLGGVFMVLLIACANVANLLLGQASARMKEVGVRAALGASRARIVTQLLTEPLATALLGSVLGVGLAWLGIRAFVRAIEDTNRPYWLQFGLDGPVLLFVLALALFAALASGVLPALRATGGSMNEILKDETRGTSSFRIGRLSRGLVIFEIALSCGLLVAAGLMIKSVANLRNIDFGFDTGQVFTARVGLPEAEYPDSAAQLAFFQELHRRLGEVPQARAVALVDALPGTWAPGTRVALEGQAYAEMRDHPNVRRVVAAPGFFDAVEVGILEGRDFGAQDEAGTLPVAIVNESFARRHFPDGSPVGRRVQVGVRSDPAAAPAPWRTVVGVVPDMHVAGVENEDPAAVYLPVAQSPVRFMSILARGPANPLALTGGVREAVATVDADIPLYFVDTLAARIGQQTWFYNVFGALFMVFGFVALFLAAIGLYGVMAFSVSRRTREMGVRMALGAKARDVLRLVMRQGVAQLAIGLTVGMALAAGVSQLVATALFQVEPRDPVIFASIVAVLTVTGLLASWIPARRATRVHPMEALRYE
jgi:putative ABC transport system permease protein